MLKIWTFLRTTERRRRERECRRHEAILGGYGGMPPGIFLKIEGCTCILSLFGARNYKIFKQKSVFFLHFFQTTHDSYKVFTNKAQGPGGNKSVHPLTHVTIFFKKMFKLPFMQLYSAFCLFKSKHPLLCRVKKITAPTLTRVTKIGVPTPLLG